jgi:hypothetical protein
MNNSMHSLFQQDTATTAATTSGNSNTASPRTARFASSSSSASHIASTATAAGNSGATTATASKQQEVDFIKLNYVLTRPPPAPEGSSQAKQKAIAAQEVTHCITFYIIELLIEHFAR